jgi:hypothetical protein
MANKKFSEGSQRDLLKPLFLWHFSKKLKMKIFIFKSNKFNQSAIKEILGFRMALFMYF